MKKTIGLLLLSFFMLFICEATYGTSKQGQALIDSLVNELEKYKSDDKQTVNILSEIADQ